MLINLSNHPHKEWQFEQLAKARKDYQNVHDISFPKVDPEANTDDIRFLASQYIYQCSELIENTPNEKNAIHVMGESTFVYVFVLLAQARNWNCIASTTERSVSFSENGEKISVFHFIRFRSFPHFKQLL